MVVEAHHADGGLVADGLGHLSGTGVSEPATQLDGDATLFHQSLANLHGLGVVVDCATAVNSTWGVTTV